MEAVKIVRMLCRCPQCRRENRVVVSWDYPPKYHKCGGCNELVPLGGYKVLTLSNDPQNPIF